MKKKYLFFIPVIIILVAITLRVFLYQSNSSSLLKECPDEWIEDRMPAAESDDSERQYFIFQGERKEIKYYDVDWIKNNCSVQVQYAY